MNRFSRPKSPAILPGNWYRVQLPDVSPEEINDRIEMEERNKDRVRILFDRYGILFREILARELPGFNWSDIFRSLRRMELSGEVLAGYFFHGIPGPQFISHKAFQMLRRPMTEDRVFWINAADPGSLCGVQLDALKGMLPNRISGNHLVYRGNLLVLISQRHGKILNVNVPPDDPRLPEYLGVLRHLMTRKFIPKRRITIETINGEVASRSAYVDALQILFEVLIDYKTLTLYRKRDNDGAL